MSPTRKIRFAEPSDQSAIDRLHRRSSWVAGEVRAALEAHPDALGIAPEAIAERRVRVVVGERHELLGFAVVADRSGSDVELDALSVDPDHMRTGIGCALVEDAAMRAAAAGMHRMTVVADPRNFAFYESVRFARGESEQTRFGPATRMWRELGGARTVSWSAGLRAGSPYALAGFLLSLSFGIIARQAGLSAFAAIAMSAVVFAGSAQFAAISIFAAGGGLGAALAAAAMMNARFLPMGIALAPSLPGNAVKRAIQGQTVVDSSWAMANRRDGSFDRWFLFGSTAVQYVTWFAGTTVGALFGTSLGDPGRFGLDAIFPTFFLALLIAELRTRHARVVAAVGALIALALVPVTPAGVPILAASAAALLGIGVGRP